MLRKKFDPIEGGVGIFKGGLLDLFTNMDKKQNVIMDKANLKY